MLSYSVCYRCWDKMVAAPSTNEVDIPYEEELTWLCSLPPEGTRFLTGSSDIPEDCICKFEQSVYAGMEKDKE